MPRIFVGTTNGLLRFERGSDSPQGFLDGRAVSAIAPAGWKRLWAVVGDREVWRADELDGEWKRVASLDGREGECLADTRANDENGILVGTAQAHLVRVTDDVVEVVDSFEHASGRDDWYTPWGGPPAVRSITENRGAVFVNVHVGGVLRSRDEGASWEPTIDIHADVHRVVTGAGRVFAAGARGLSVSGDDGANWRLNSKGLHGTYCRSVTVCGDAVLVSASDGPRGGRAELYRTGFEGGSLEKCRGGLPDWFDGNIDSLCLDALPDGSFSAFASESGDVFTSTDQGSSWSQVAAGVSGVRCLLVVP